MMSSTSYLSESTVTRAMIRVGVTAATIRLGRGGNVNDEQKSRNKLLVSKAYHGCLQTAIIRLKCSGLLVEQRVVFG